MSTRITRRRLMAVGGQAVAVAGASKFFFASAQSASAKYQSVYPALDRFVEQYMREMNSPGMTLVLADRDGIARVAAYGLSDLEQKIAVKPEQLFHIGSISKSFTAIALLQLHEEGKLDLHKPVLDYLPWLKIETKYTPITTHHLLTHSSGLPGNMPIWLSDPNAKHRVGFETGKYFHYCNLGYDILGQLLSALDRRPYGESIRARILQPLGMTATEPAITSDLRERTAKSYMAYHDERPLPRYGKLAEAPQIIFEKGSGSIASTPHDMGIYISMISNRGKGPNTTILKPETFAIFVKPHIKADEFGPTASYGYGLATDTMNGHAILRHTGGMVSFMSAMQIDMDEGVGAFASINAMQGYRPNPVAVYALQAMRAAREAKAAPPLPAPNPPTKIPNAKDYAGVFSSPDDGRKLEFVSEGDALYVVKGGKRIPLETTTGSGLVANDPELGKSAFTFARVDGEKGPVTEVAHGSGWYVKANYSGPLKFDHPKAWDGFVGHYRNDSPWIGSFRILLRKGKLWVDGVVPLVPIDERAALFQLADPPYSPEWIQFLSVAEGRCRQVKLSGEDFWRVEAK
jgi:D-alanyl-D-alanine carboxypeptidase